MEDWESRLVDEHAELEERTEKLAAFINSKAYDDVSVQDRDYLEEQLGLQQKLLRVLTSRVTIQKNKTDAAKAEAAKKEAKENTAKKDAVK